MHSSSAHSRLASRRRRRRRRDSDSCRRRSGRHRDSFERGYRRLSFEHGCKRLADKSQRRRRKRRSEDRREDARHYPIINKRLAISFMSRVKTLGVHGVRLREVFMKDDVKQISDTYERKRLRKYSSRSRSRVQKPVVIRDLNGVWATIKHSQVFSDDFPRCRPVAFDSPRPDDAIRIVCLSDMHGMHRGCSIPPGDVLIIAGDISDRGNPEQILDFCEWIEGHDFLVKIVIAGNHDMTLDRKYYFERAKERFKLPDVEPNDLIQRLSAVSTYLNDRGTTIFPLKDGTGGIQVWGTPWVARYSESAFSRDRGPLLNAKWSQIPTDSDVVVVHGPPLGRGDLTAGGARSGCVDLLNQIQDRIQPQLVVHGHIHEGRGYSSDGKTTYVNAAAPHKGKINDPIVVDLKLPRAIDKTTKPIRWGPTNYVTDEKC